MNAIKQFLAAIRNKLAFSCLRYNPPFGRWVGFLLLLPTLSFAQITFQKTIGGSDTDAGAAILQAAEGGYAIAGITRSYGAGKKDVYFIRTDKYGDTLWTRVYGGAGDDVGGKIKQLWDNGYVIIGYTESFGAGGRDIYLIRTNSKGDTLWTKTYGGTSDDYGSSIAYYRTPADSGFVLTGHTYSYGQGDDDVYVIRTKINGDTLWTRSYGGAMHDEAYSIQQTADDNGLIIAGYTKNMGPEGKKEMLLIKTNSNGDTLWTKGYGGSKHDVSFSVQRYETAADSGYLMVGYSNSFGIGLYDVYFIKTKLNGDTVFTKTYGGGNSEGYGSVLKTFPDDGYILGGTTLTFGGGSWDGYLIKTNSNGDTLWTKAYGGAAYDGFASIQQTTDGGFIMTGVTSSSGAGLFDVFVVKTDGVGNSGCNEFNTATTPGKPSSRIEGNASMIKVGNPGASAGNTSTKIKTGGKASNVCPCPLANAGIDVTINPGNSITLTASGGTSYQWSNGATAIAITVAPSVTTSYTVIVTDTTNGCSGSDWITVFVDIPCGELFVPNAFSPNNDGKNDILYVRMNCIETLLFRIYNRWGNKVFESDDIAKGWDGTYKGKQINSAVFVYYLEVTLQNGNKIGRQGNVSLVR